MNAIVYWPGYLLALRPGKRISGTGRCWDRIRGLPELRLIAILPMKVVVFAVTGQRPGFTAQMIEH